MMNAPDPSKVKYDHWNNRHTVAGAVATLASLLDPPLPASLLDVGCGTGTWLRAALDHGVRDVRGIDGIALPPASLHVPSDRITVHDLRDDWRMDRRFDLVLCLEVAEHLPPDHAASFIRRLTACGDRIFFSAANPWQGGQNHLNPQWPAYWQGFFNKMGFVCRDTLRWRIWEDETIEPWYRQNLFLAGKDEAAAGTEPRIPAVIHPDGMAMMVRHWRSRQQSLLEGAARAVDRAIRKGLGMKTDA